MWLGLSSLCPPEVNAYKGSAQHHEEAIESCGTETRAEEEMEVRSCAVSPGLWGGGGGGGGTH